IPSSLSESNVIIFINSVLTPSIEIPKMLMKNVLVIMGIVKVMKYNTIVALMFAADFFVLIVVNAVPIVGSAGLSVFYERSWRRPGMQV
ncbi:MAG: hypothetical protein KJ882_12855, partial [Proteobacteria bacterium]|nr:hypothetical protein [Pseudomonadota bacterium]